MRPIAITDITMRQSSRSEDFSLSFQEKIELCKLLDRLGVNAIETTPISKSRATSLLIKSIASIVRESTLAVPVGLDPDLIPIAEKALQEAAEEKAAEKEKKTSEKNKKPGLFALSGLLREHDGLGAPRERSRRPHHRHLSLCL